MEIKSVLPINRGGLEKSSTVDRQRQKEERAVSLEQAKADQRATVASTVTDDHNFKPEGVNNTQKVKDGYGVQSTNDLTNRELEKKREAEERAKEEKEKEKPEEAFAQAKEQLESLQGKQLVLKFESSEEFDKNIVNVIDTQSDEVIRQIPSEEILRVSQTIQDYVERVNQLDMMTDPKLKANGENPKAARENLRGVVLDDMA